MDAGLREIALTLYVSFSAFAASTYLAALGALLSGKLRGKARGLALQALAWLVISTVAVALHLTHPENAFYAFTNLDSPLAREVLALLALGIFMLIFIFTAKAHPKCAICAGLAGAAVALVYLALTGLVYVLPARPAWNTMLIPVNHALSSVVLSLYIYSYAAASAEEGRGKGSRRAVLVATLLLLLNVVTFALYMLHVLGVPELQGYADLMNSVYGLAALRGILGFLAPIALTLASLGTGGKLIQAREAALLSALYIASGIIVENVLIHILDIPLDLTARVPV